MASSASARSQNGASDGMVEILPVGVAVDHGARELQLASCSVRARRRRLWRPASADGRSRNSGPAASALRGRGNRCRRARCGRRSAASRSACTPGPAIDSTARSMPAPSMDFEPQLAEVGEPRHHLREDGGIDVGDRGLPVVLEARAQEVLLQRDLPDHSFLVRFPAAPLYRSLVRVYQSAKQAHDGAASAQRQEPDSGDRAARRRSCARWRTRRRG